MAEASLRTKDEKHAKVLAKPVMMRFDRILAEAEALLIERPVRTEMTEAEMKQVSDYFYALQLHSGEDLRAEGEGDDPLYADVHRQLTEAGVEFESPFSVGTVGSGLSDRMMHEIDEGTSIVLPALKKALARGNIEFRRSRGGVLWGFSIIRLGPSSGDGVAPHVLEREGAAWLKRRGKVNATVHGSSLGRALALICQMNQSQRF